LAFDLQVAISYRCSIVTKSLSPAIFEIGTKHIGVTTLTFQGHVTSSVTWPLDSRWSIQMISEVQRENTPYSSSEPNESDIVNRQSRSSSQPCTATLNPHTWPDLTCKVMVRNWNMYLNFTQGVHITWYCACAMTI